MIVFYVILCFERYKIYFEGTLNFQCKHIHAINNNCERSVHALYCHVDIIFMKIIDSCMHAEVRYKAVLHNRH